MKRYITLFGAELVVVGVVPLIFRFIESRLHAGILAGMLFILIGLYAVVSGWAAGGRKSLSFWAGILHLGVSALPLFITRLLNANSKFENVLVLGMPGPVFHQFSTIVYSVLLLATALDIGIAFKRSRLAS